MRILLAEDEGKVASFIARALQENAYAVDVAETGEKALELGQDTAYDAILLDIGLPGLSGIEVCRELRQREIEVPILMLTAPSSSVPSAPVSISIQPTPGRRGDLGGCPPR